MLCDAMQCAMNYDIVEYDAMDGDHDGGYNGG